MRSLLLAPIAPTLFAPAASPQATAWAPAPAARRFVFVVRAGRACRTPAPDAR
jgi:hypothetical protein